MPSSFQQKLTRRFQKFPTAPFLFVGSGLARRYLGTPNWEGLLAEFCRFTGKEMGYYKSSADGDLARAGGLLAKDFHDIWWESSHFEESRTTFKHYSERTESALKIEISNYLKHASHEILPNQEVVDEVDAFRQIVADGIITTNWDLLLEDLFQDYKVYVGQELVLGYSHDVGEIYKIHGCCTQPNSLVLTDQDYATFRDRNAYLAAKLVTVFIEHPVVFLGTSLTDDNIRELLLSIARCMSPERLEKFGERLIFVQWDEDEANGRIESSHIFLGNRPIPVVLTTLSSFLPLYAALGSIERHFPAGLLRKLKKHVYELVKSNDPKEQILVSDIDSDTEDLSGVEVVFGVGAIKEFRDRGYTGFTREHLAADIAGVKPLERIEPNAIVSKTLPGMLNGSRKYVPVFKYVAKSGLPMGGLKPNVREAIERASIRFYGPPGNHYQARRRAIKNEGMGLADLEDKCGPTLALRFASFVAPERLNPSEIREFLSKYWEDGDIRGKYPTDWYKLVCLYDFLMFGEEVKKTLRSG